MAGTRTPTLSPYPMAAPEAWNDASLDLWDATDAQGDASHVVENDVIRCVTLNTRCGRGPHVRYVLRGATPDAAERALLLDETRAYAYHIADWIRRRRDRYEVVALQEVFHGILGFGARPFGGRFRQRDYYRALTEFPQSIAHRVGFAGYRYENVLLSRLAPAPDPRIQSHLPCRVYRLAACGFTLAPFRVAGRTVWIGNTHLHAYNPRARAKQAAAIAREVRRLGDVPILFLGDFNTVPPGCKDGDFPDGDRDVRSYRDDHTLQILARAGLRAAPHEDREPWWTYPTGAPNRTLDFVLHTRHFDVEDYRVVRDFALSDHLPVEGTFRLRAS
jgi:endonuclease/exonuclease/phosphatase family metal-dependent hydrolase